ncbi:fructosamine kinase [Gordonia iterans]|uniref:Fructosamine kinase n=1 Tax=Gordonia iterans TaxID=1004901 RepID=A0A2S0KK01_9ACTN|nr:fructosamine kinase family protein [Gordonia iterans]AVM01993.1 fructosamine kinase [Gordonia iterans]
MASHDLSSLPPELIDGLGVRSAWPVSGGDIAWAYRLDTADGPLFLKWRPDASPGLFQREAAGLQALRAHSGELCVPEVLRESASGLVLEWIESGPSSSTTEADLGRGLAALHRTTNPSFGGLDGVSAGYLGSAQVDLTPTADWPEFFVERRVRPLIDRGIAEGAVPAEARSLIDRLAPRAAELCGPPEPPALVHGDLWAGNRMVGAGSGASGPDGRGADGRGTGGRNWLIDPAAHWAHREIDLAMMTLFGGFGPDGFAAYDEAFPLAEGWRERLRWYQLPPLLVHAILFGDGYGAEALAVLRHYAR